MAGLALTIHAMLFLHHDPLSLYPIHRTMPVWPAESQTKKPHTHLVQIYHQPRYIFQTDRNRQKASLAATTSRRTRHPREKKKKTANAGLSQYKSKEQTPTTWINMLLTKQPTPKQLERHRKRILRNGIQIGTSHGGFSQARLDRICNSMQPLMTKHASDEEMKSIFRDADAFVAGGGSGKRMGLRGCLRSCFGRFRGT